MKQIDHVPPYNVHIVPPLRVGRITTMKRPYLLNYDHAIYRSFQQSTLPTNSSEKSEPYCATLYLIPITSVIVNICVYHCIRDVQACSLFNSSNTASWGDNPLNLPSSKWTFVDSWGTVYPHWTQMSISGIFSVKLILFRTISDHYDHTYWLLLIIRIFKSEKTRQLTQVICTSIIRTFDYNKYCALKPMGPRNTETWEGQGIW